MKTKGDCRCSTVVEQDILFNHNIVDVVLRSGLPRRIRVENGIVILGYDKSVLGFRVNAEYSFVGNRLSTVDYLHSTLGFESIDDFLCKCERHICRSFDEEMICYSHSNIKSWNITDGRMCKHIHLIHNDKSAKLTIVSGC